MKRASHITATVALLLALFQASALGADPPEESTIYVSFNEPGLTLTSTPVAGTAFVGTIGVVDPSEALQETGETRQPIVSEEWNEAGKPPYLTVYTLRAKAYGMGELHMSLKGKSRHYDIGNFRDPTKKPTPAAVGDNDEFVNYREKHKTVHRYYLEPYTPSDEDTCIPVLNKGFAGEVKPGHGDLRGFRRCLHQVYKGGYRYSGADQSTVRSRRR